MWFVTPVFATGGSPPPAQELVWPDRNTLAADGVLVYAERVAGLPEPTVIGPDGAAIDFVVHRLPGEGDVTSWLVLAPAAPLTPGLFQASDGGYGAPVALEVVGALAPLGSTPIPARRYDDGCALTTTYRLCNAGPLVVFATGAEPAPITLDDLGAARVVSGGAGDTFNLPSGVVGPAPVTVWIGVFDQAGRFAGWSAPDEVVTEPGLWVEWSIDPTDSPGTTPTTLGVCVAAPWSRIDDRSCPPEDTADTGTGGSDGCGCASSSGGVSPAWFALVAVLSARRRRS